MAVVFSAFVIIGIAVLLLPLYVHDGLGFGPMMVGIVTGGQFAAALVARMWSGRTADTGPVANPNGPSFTGRLPYPLSLPLRFGAGP